MKIKKFNFGAKNAKTIDSITEEFETLRTKLNEFADNDGKLSDDEEMLEISQRMDELHLEYIRIMQAQKELG